VANLKQVGLAFRMWGNDHAERFPWAVSATEGGTLEFIATEEVFRHFQAASNELNSPKILHCRTDQDRVRATNFAAGFGNRNLSYFVCLDAGEPSPSKLLSGDHNLTGGVMNACGIMTLKPDATAGYTSEMHGGVGNVGLADGSVSQVTSLSLSRALRAITNESIRLAIPLVPRSQPR
jgi:prepilin-type processing-associated H-X9-DG protein